MKNRNTLTRHTCDELLQNVQATEIRTGACSTDTHFWSKQMAKKILTSPVPN